MFAAENEFLRTFIIEGSRVSVDKDKLKKYSYIGPCYTNEGVPLEGVFYQREDGQLVNKNYTNFPIYTDIYDEHGKSMNTYNEAYFNENCKLGLELNNKLYLEEELNGLSK